MSNQRFLYCHNCNAVHHVTPYHTAPIFEIDGIEIQEIPRDDCREFLDRHSGHRIGELIGTDEEHREQGRFVDPMRVNHFGVTDGRETFLVRSFRTSIAEPLKYRVLPRQLTFCNIVGTTPRNPGVTRQSRIQNIDIEAQLQGTKQRSDKLKKT
jgi:hypothetical protein